MLTLRGPSGPRRGADLRNLGIIQDGAVLIVDGLVREVGPSRRVENLAAARSAIEINATGMVVLPGFVDSNAHLVSGAARLLDYEMRLAGATESEIEAAGGGLQARVRDLQNVSARTLEVHGQRILADCAAQGTTTVEARSGFGATEAAETKILRAGLALDNRPVSVVSTFMAGLTPVSGDDYVTWLCSHLLPLIRRRRLAEFAGVRCGAGGFTPEQSGRFLTTARQLGFAYKISTGPVALALEFGAASLDGLTQISTGDADLLARSQTIATLLPGPVFHMGSHQYAPARDLIDRGVAVALGTNYNPETCPSHNMQMMLSLACRHMGMTPAEAVSGATINGAHAVRRAARIGSIEFGKDADLLLLSVSDYREIPLHFGVNLVEMTIKRGLTVYHKPEAKWPVK